MIAFLQIDANLYPCKHRNDDESRLVLTSIHVVAEEQIVGLGWKATVLEQSQQIGILAVNVAADLQRCFQLQQDRLLKENLARLQA